MKDKNEEIVEEYRKKFLLATGERDEDHLQIYCSRCAGSDEFEEWLLNTLTTKDQEIQKVVEEMEQNEVYLVESGQFHYAGKTVLRKYIDKLKALTK